MFTDEHSQQVERRVIERFAWLPVRLVDGTWRHLGWVRCEQELVPDESGWTTGTWWTRRTTLPDQSAPLTDVVTRARSARDMGMPTPIRYASCPICGGRVSRWREKNRASTRFTIDRCRPCRYAFVNPRPSLEALVEYYTANPTQRAAPVTAAMVRAEGENDPSQLVAPRLVIGRIRDLLPAAMRRPHLLDVGCGFGVFSREAQARGFSIVGIELADEERVVTAELTGQVPLNIAFEEYDAEPDSFDAVLMSQILEHAVDVDAWIDHARRLLRADGVLAIAVPNFGSVFRRVMQERDVYVCPPDHLNFFTATALRRLLAAHGFTVQRVAWYSRFEPTTFTRHLGPLGRIVGPMVWGVMRVLDRVGLGLILYVHATKRPDR